MKISQDGIDLVKFFEGFYTNAYLCPAGVWTIGYGTTEIGGHPVIKGMTCTASEAESYLAEDLEHFERVVKKAVTIDLSQSQFDALVSICYNVGPGAKGIRDGIITLFSGSPSTLLKCVNAGDFDGACSEFLRWNKAGGKVLAGLSKRRMAESVMFSGGDWRGVVAV
jgi:lysozyme